MSESGYYQGSGFMTKLKSKARVQLHARHDGAFTLPDTDKNHWNIIVWKCSHCTKTVNIFFRWFSSFESKLTFFGNTSFHHRSFHTEHKLTIFTGVSAKFERCDPSHEDLKPLLTTDTNRIDKMSYSTTNNLYNHALKNSYRQFGTLLIGFFWSNLDSRHLEKCPMTSYGEPPP